MKCPNCGIEVGEFPEDARYEETLCNRCYGEEEEAVNERLSGSVLNGFPLGSC